MRIYYVNRYSLERDYMIFHGVKVDKPEENDEAAIIQKAHLALPTSSAKAFSENERLS